jgi:VCBS repeat-containing protein
MSRPRSTWFRRARAFARGLGPPLCLLLAAPAWAQTRPKPDVRSDPRPTEAKAACVSGDVQKGVRLLGDLYVATNDAIWIFNQGRCYQQNGQTELALARFKEYLRKAKNADPEDIKEAQNYVKELEAELAARQAPAPVAPAPEPRASRSTTELDGNGGPGGLGVSGGLTRRRRFNDRQIAGMVVSGVGVLSLVAGGFFSYKVQSTEDEVNKLAKGEGPLVEAATLKDKDRSGARYELVQWICYGIGVAALAVGTTTFLLGRPSVERGDGVALSLSPLLGPGMVGSGLRGSF